MSNRPVVIGVDFTGATTHGTSWVSRYMAPNAPIVLVHARQSAEIPSFLRHLVAPPDPEREHEAIAVRVREWSESAGLSGAAIIVRHGRPDEVLRAVARETGADLMVIGPHGGTERPWRRLGTTAERLLRAAETSLLVLRGSMAHQPKRVLVAVDDAGITPRLLHVAGTLADRFDASLHGVHVLSNAAYSHMLSMEAIESHSDAEKRSKLEADLAGETLRWLRALWQNTDQHGKLEAEVAHGAPADEILRAAERLGADLIVIGRYGIGRTVPAFLGSVVGSVVQGAMCPVLTVAGD